ncbi:MFS transporter [Streptantibioticus silvisoli]|uniref:MFS transporter n=1 Tax=Streptantibioticus silvisoli TaxID=2705255 RepID=A0ABT6VSB7_9ACTN|nr:MFS transporter [Streptantibioticus silvisoli]MDI5961376.1 MFS transporter [Streptantibioticus silvisoli]
MNLVRRNRNFRLYLLARCITALTLAIGPTVMAFAVLRVDHSVGAVATVVTASQLPIMVFVLIGGVLGDRYGRMSMLAGANVISGLSQIAMMVLLLTGTATVTTLAVAAAVGGMATAVALPAGGGFVAQIVAPAEVGQAQALLSVTRTTLMVVGAAAGGVMVGFLGTAPALLVNGLLYAASAPLLMMVVAPGASRAVCSSLAGSLRDGWQEFWGHRWLTVTLAQTLVYSVCVAAGFQVLGPAVASQRLDGAAGLGLLMAARALGSVVGAVMAMRARSMRLYPAQAGLAVQAAILALMGLSAPFTVLLVAIAAEGVASEYFQVVWQTNIQLRIDVDMLSRVTSYPTLVNYGSTPLASALVVLAHRHLSYGGVFLLLAVFTLCATLTTIASPSVRKLGTAQLVMEHQSQEEVV